MTLSEARSRAADAIRKTMPRGVLWKGNVIQADQVRVEALLNRAGTLPNASARTAGKGGPAMVVVTVTARNDAAAVAVEVYTVTKDPIDLISDRGLMAVDAVERALRTLPGSDLPLLKTSTGLTVLPPRIDDNKTNIWMTQVVWPSADPGEPDGQPLATAIGDSIGAIYHHVSDGVAVALAFVTPAALEANGALQARYDADLTRRGDTEARRRQATFDGLVPRCEIDVSSERATFGGGTDLLASPFTWGTADGRMWTGRAVRQRVTVEVRVWHRSERLADEAALKIISELDQSVVTWPGDFNARVLQADGTLAVERLTNGNYQNRMDVVGRAQSAWDSDTGLALASATFTVLSVAPIEPANVHADVNSIGLTRTLEAEV